MIRTLCVFYRPIGCADEASTDEEQGEKILYYYPEASLSKQLSRVTMLEGLIEFTAKFSKAPIETAMMENQTWAFVQCEPELWIVAAVDNDSGVAEAASTSFEDSQSDQGQQQNQHHRPNSMCFFDALMKMYRVFCLLRGNLVNVIRGKNGSGMEHVQKVQDERKRIRKLKIKLRQEHLDLANVTRRAAEQRSPYEGEGEGEELGIRGDGVSLEDTQRTVDETLAQIAAAEERLAALLDESTTYPPRLARAMLVSFFSWYLPTNELNNPCAFHSASGVHFCPVGHPAFQYLLRVRQAAEDISRGILRGCLLLHDGGVAWSDFDDETTFTIYEFLRLCEGDHVRSSLQRHLNTQARSGGPSSGGGGAPHSGSSGLGGLAARMKRSSVSSPSHGSGQLHSSSSSASASSASVEGEDLAQGEAEWARRLLAAKGFVTGSNPVWGAAGLEDAVTLQGSDSDEAGGGGGGGASASPTSSATATSSPGNAFLGADCVTARNIWCPRIFACDSRVARRGGASTAKRRSSGHGLVKGDLALSAGVCQCLGRAVVYRQGLFFLVMLFPDWSDEEGGPPFAMDHIDKAMRRQDEASFSSSSSTGVPPTGSWTRRVGESSLLNLCASLERGLSAELDLLDRSVGLEARCIDAASGALGAGAGAAGAGVASSRASVETPPSSSSSSSSPQGKKRQKVLPDTVRLLYFNACNRALKAGSFLRKSDLSPLLLRPTTSPLPRSLSLSLALDRVSHHFPVPSALLSSFVEPAVLRAMNDLRETLSSRSREGGGVTESCLRVSTQQRGGVWVVGRRFGGRFLLAVVEKCSTLNEVYDAFEVVCSEVYSQIVIS